MSSVRTNPHTVAWQNFSTNHTYEEKRSRVRREVFFLHFRYLFVVTKSKSQHELQLTAHWKKGAFLLSTFFRFLGSLPKLLFLRIQLLLKTLVPMNAYMSVWQIYFHLNSHKIIFFWFLVLAAVQWFLLPSHINEQLARQWQRIWLNFYFLWLALAIDLTACGGQKARVIRKSIL